MMSIDVFICSLEPDYSNPESMKEYCDQFKGLNQVLGLFVKELSLEEAKFFDSGRIDSIFQSFANQAEKLVKKLRENRLDIYSKYRPDLVEYIAELKEGALQEGNFLAA